MSMNASLDDEPLMVIYPDFTQYRGIRTALTAHAVPMVGRFIGNLMVTVTLAALIGVVLGTVAGFLVVVALW